MEPSDDMFEDFYSNYRTFSADNQNLQNVSEQVMQKRKEEKHAAKRIHE